MVYSLTQKTLQLQLAKKERDSALKQHEANIAYLRPALDAQARGKGVGTGVEELRSAQSRLHESENALDALGRKISMRTEEIRTVGRDIQQVRGSHRGQAGARRELEGGMRDRLKEIEDRLPRRGSSPEAPLAREGLVLTGPVVAGRAGRLPAGSSQPHRSFAPLQKRDPSPPVHGSRSRAGSCGARVGPRGPRRPSSRVGLGGPEGRPPQGRRGGSQAFRRGRRSETPPT